MKIEDMIGQMVWVGFQGTEPSEEVRRLIWDYRVGGVVLFSRNVQTPKQVRALTDALREIAREAGHPVPLLVAVDQEGGNVARLREGFTQFPSAMAMGATRSSDLVRRAAEVTAEELKVVGIGVNFAPVLDVNVNPENPIIGIRSYGEDPELVARLGEAAVCGYQSKKVAATAKHFPGHGDTSLDTHLTLPRVSHPLERLENVELLPFRRAVDAGVRAVMTTHILFDALDPDLPATLSHKILTDLLRGDMGFSGVIITDCMEMKAMDRFWPEAPLSAVQAGADVVLISHTYDRQVEALELLRRAAEDGRLSPERISASAERIYALKRWVRIPSISPEEAPDLVGRPEDLDFARELARSVLTLVRDRRGTLPLRLTPKDRLLLVLPKALPKGAAEDPVLSVEVLAVESLRRHPTVEVLRVSPEPSEDEVRYALQLASEVKAVVVASRDAHLRPQYARLVRALAGFPLIVLGIGAPYELQALPEVGTYIAAYGDQRPLMEAAVEVLFGEQKASDKLPITVERCTD